MQLVLCPQLSDFGAAIVHKQNQQVSGCTKPFRVVGTFGYLAPEYMMYGKVDEKVDVYSYGVVLLELITGKEAIQTTQASNHESLVLWVREKAMYFLLFGAMRINSLNVFGFNRKQVEFSGERFSLCRD